MKLNSFPQWLEILARISLLMGILCMVIVIVDIVKGRRQRMWIMEVVWPITMLYSSVIGLWAYWKIGRPNSMGVDKMGNKMGSKMEGNVEKPFWQSVVVGATHCGSGCTLGDIISESFFVFFTFTLFGKTIFGSWLIDYILAFLLGIAFQYFTIKPMRNLSVGEGLLAAIKADFLSLTSWQVGMYGWMGIVVFLIFGSEIDKRNAVFWFMMQIAMLFGFITSFPVNWWLLKTGIKERM